MGRYDLTDFEWRVIEPLLPNKPRGVARVDDRRVLNGILWVLRSGAPWRDLPEHYGPYTTCYNRFNRWRKKGVWDRLMDAVVHAYDGNVQMIDSSSVRVHQHAEPAVRRRSFQGADNEVAMEDGRTMAWRFSGRVRRLREAPCCEAAMHRSKNGEPSASISSHSRRRR